MTYLGNHLACSFQGSSPSAQFPKHPPQEKQHTVSCLPVWEAKWGLPPKIIMGDPQGDCLSAPSAATPTTPMGPLLGSSPVGSRHTSCTTYFQEPVTVLRAESSKAQPSTAGLALDHMYSRGSPGRGKPAASELLGK